MRNMCSALQARERAWLAVADVLYVNSIQAKERFEQTFDGLEVPVEVMRNAADYALADEVVASVSTVAPHASSAPVVLGYFGTIFPRRMLTPLFAAMEQLDPAVLEQLRVEVYCDAGDSRALLERDLENASPSVAVRVIRRDYLPYAQALAAMRAASALVLVNGQDPSDSVFVPGKLFDGELIVGHILIESTYNPVAIGPNITGTIFLITITVCIACEV